MLDFADIRLIGVGGLQHVLLQLVVAFHVQQAENHVQLIHKFMRCSAQGIDIVHHPVEPLQQLADFGFVTKSANCADHVIPVANGDRVADQQQTVAPQLAIVNRLAGLQNLLQIRQQRRLRDVAIGAAEQDIPRGGVNQRHLAVGVHRHHALF